MQKIVQIDKMQKIWKFLKKSLAFIVLMIYNFICSLQDNNKLNPIRAASSFGRAPDS